MNKACVNLLKATTLTLAMGLVNPVSAAAVEWSYAGADGPAFWHELSADFAACESTATSKQSPVNIDTSLTAIIPLRKLKTDFDSYPLNVENNGHTIQVNYAPGGTTTIKNGDYHLLQFHFHTDSEHAIDAALSPMEIHFVHMNSKGQLAVIGVMVTEGAHNEALQVILANAPAHAGEKHALHNDNAPAINVSALLPASKIKNYYHYSGSLTTPPCSEGVSWYVASDPITASLEQLEGFRHLMVHDVGQTGNNRPLQPLNDRVIKEAK